MRGLMIFHDHEISFCHADKELEKYLKERWIFLQKSAGATDTDLLMKEFSSICQEFLQPFCTAFDALVLLKKRMHCISLEDGFMIVFRKFGQSLYIALSKGHGETEEDLSKKMQVFNSILSFLMGPIRRRIRPRERIQKALEQLLMTYERLYDEEEVFLLEAVEHVTFGQLQAAQDVVVKLAKESLESSNNGGLAHVQHAMLMVNTKLLTICGKSPQIQTSDILLLTLFVCCFFNATEEEETEEEREEEEREEEEEEDGGEIYGEMEGINTQTSVVTETSPDRSEVFQTPPMSTPGPYIEPEDPPFSTPGPEADPAFTAPIEEVDHMTSMREASNPNRSIPGRLRNLFGLRSARTGDTEIHEEEAEDSAKSCQFVEQLVFLQPNTATFIPHYLHCLEVCPGIVLVLISEYGMSQLAGTISSILHHIDEIFNCNRRGGQSIFDLLEESFRRTNSLVRHEFQTTASDSLRQCNIRVQNAWANLKEAGLRSYITSSETDDSEVNQARLESSSSSLVKWLVELFEQLFFTPKQREYDTAHVKTKLIRNFSGLRKDYGEFLALKGTMNIPMLNFSMCHPGMVHFILVDRSFDEMITPSIHCDQPVGIHYVERLASEKGITSGALLKKTIWKMVKRSQRYLGHGHTCQVWLDQDFLCSYYIWVNFHSLAHNESRRYMAPTVKPSESLPGTIGNSFYRDLAQGQCYVFELYCIHEAAVPIKTAAMQCRELTNQLWPNTTASVAPFSLIN